MNKILDYAGKILIVLALGLVTILMIEGIIYMIFLIIGSVKYMGYW